MSDYKLPELPSDEELGIAGMELDDDAGADGGEAGGKAPPTGGPAGPGGPGGPERPAARETPDRPRRRWRGPLTLAVLALLAWTSSPAWTLPDPVPATAPDSAFSSARAMVRLVELARQPHAPGSPEHARVRGEIVGTLEELGLAPDVWTTTSVVRRGQTVRAATVRNIVARIPGTDPTGAVLVTAHYDGRTISPAAADDMVGVVAILESVRAVQAMGPLRNDVIVLITDAEELGLLGARAFVRDHPWMQDVSVVLSVEMRGAGGPAIMFETGDENGWIVEALKAGDPHPMANSLSYEVYRRLPNDTDFTPFREAGKQGLNFAAIGRARVYHQAFDVPANVQEATVQHHGGHVLGMLRELGARDLTEVDGPDRVFFRLPFLGLVTYGTLWVPLLGVALLLGAGGVTFWSLRKGAGPGGLVAGALLGLVSTAAAAGAGWVLFRQVRGLHPEYGLLQGSAFHSEGWYVLAVVAVAFTLVTGLFGVARRRASLPGLAAGALLLPLVAALFLTFAAPLAAMNLQWPVLAGLVGVAIVASLSGSAPPGLLRGLLLLVPATGVLLFLEPLIELLWVSMSVSLLAVLGGLAALTLLMLLPLLDTLAEPNRWWAPLTGLVLAAAFVGMGLLQSRPSPERPTPSTLAWILDRTSGEARWVSREGPGLAWARERVGALETEDSLGAFLPGFQGAALVQPATPVDVAPPEVTVLPDTAGLAPGGVRLAVRSRVGAEMIQVRGTDEGLRWRAVNGQPVGEGPPASAVVHWGIPTDSTLLLDVEPPPGADSLRLEVVEHHLRPGELLGEDAFRRPPDLVPATGWISDRALLRAVVTVPARPGAELAAPPADSLGTPADTVTAPPDTAPTAPEGAGRALEGRTTRPGRPG